MSITQSHNSDRSKGRTITMQCHMTQRHNSNGTLRHNDIRKNAQLQQDKGTVVMTIPTAKLKMNLCSPGLDAQTILLTMQPRFPVTNDGVKTFALETISPICYASFGPKRYIRLKTGLRRVKTCNRSEKSPCLHCTSSLHVSLKLHKEKLLTFSTILRLPKTANRSLILLKCP